MDTESGILNCAVHSKERKLAELKVDVISDDLQEEGTFLWVSLLERGQALMRKIQEAFGLHELAVEDARRITRALIQDFHELKNELLMLQAVAVPLIDIGTQLLRFRSDIIAKENSIYYWNIVDHSARVTQTAKRTKEMIDAAMQVALTRVTIRQNEVVKRLTGWGAILAVPTMVFSWYRMNFRFMPDLK